MTQKSSSVIPNTIAYLLAIIPFIVAPFWWYSFITGRLLLWCVTVIIAILFLWSQYGHAKMPFFSDRRLAWFGLFVMWLLLRGVSQLSLEWWGTWIRSDSIFLLLSIVPVMAVLLYAQNMRAKNIGALFVIVLLIGTVLGKLIVLAPGAQLLVADTRWAGTVGNALFFGTLLLFLPFMSSQWFETVPRTKKIILQTCAVLVTIFLLYKTGSRGTFVAAFIGAGAYAYLWARAKKMSWWKIVAPLVILVLLFIGGIRYFGGRAFTFSTQDETTQVRLQLYKNAWHEFVAHPLIGFGMEGAQDAITKNIGALDAISHADQLFDSTHSFYIDIALAGGAVALVLYGIWFVYVFQSMEIGARATFIAYHVALATAPFQMWAMPAVVLLIVLGQKKDFVHPEPKKIFGERVILGAAAIILVSSAAAMLITVPTVASRLQSVLQTEVPLIDFVDAAAQGGFFPYAVERDQLYAQRLINLMQSPSTSNLSLQLLQTTFVPRIEKAIDENNISVEPLQTYALFLENYAPHAPVADQAALYAAAEKGYREILVRAPGRPATEVSLAELLTFQGRESDVGQVLGDFIVRYPDSPTAQFYWAVHLETIGDHAGAVTHATRAFSLRDRSSWLPDQQAWFDALLKK